MPTTVLRDTTNKATYASSATTTQTISITTSGVNRLAVLLLWNRFGTRTVVSVSGGGGTWVRRNNTINDLEIWTAAIPAQQTAQTITITYSGTQTVFTQILDTYYLSNSSAVPTIDNIAINNFPSVAVNNPTNSIRSIGPFSTVINYLYATSAIGTLAVITAGTGNTLTNSQLAGAGPWYICASEISVSDTINQGDIQNPSFNVAQLSTGIMVTFTLSANPAIPSSPTGVVATYNAPSGGNGGNITISWTPPIDYTGLGYNIYRVSDSGLLLNGLVRKENNPQPYVMVPWGTNSFTDNALSFPPSRTYTYYVTTVGQGAISGTIPNSVIESPVSIAATPVAYLG